MGTEIFAVGKSGDFVQAANSLRAPISYDSTNTSYYILGSATSYLNVLVTHGSLTVGQGSSSDIYMHDSDETTRRIHCNSHRIGFLSSSNNWSAYSDNGGHWYGELSIRSPIFYDNNNTGYYADLSNATTSIAHVGNIVSANHGRGVCGLYSSTVLQNVFSMGAAYQLPAGGNTAGNLYGMAWSHPNAGTKGGANHLNDHGLLIINNGVFKAAISSRAVFSSDVRGTLFYDYNNTGYYVDPASTSNLNIVTAAGRINANGGLSQDGHNLINGSDTWYRTTGDNGIYFSSYTGGWHMTDSTWIRSYNNKSVYLANQLAVAGNITAYYSDERLKTRTGGIDNALEKVQSLSGFTYVENDLARELGYKNEKQQVGVSAQEVQAVVPEAVSLAAVDIETGEFSGEITSKSGENYLTVDYSRLVPLLIEAVKELKSEVDNLKTQLAQKEQ
tara:strand:- start:1732 stop:3066 length:1335 start_codon:yes stop_codon:yes gene_type:complete